MKTTTRFTFLVVIVTILIGCHKNNDDESYGLYHAETKYQDFDKIKDLSVYFDSISDKHPIAVWYGDEVNSKDTIKLCILQIEACRKGERQYFPDSLVRRCMDILGANIAAGDNNGAEFTSLVYAEWFMMCAAFYSPDITCLVETQTPDHCAGFYNFGHSYNDAPWWPYLFLKREKGYEVVCLGDYCKVRSIFQLTDKQNRKYYLCSDNLTSLEFYQCLFWAQNDGHYKKVAECKKVPDTDEKFSTFYFDQKQLVWKFANEDKTTGKLIPVKDEPALTLTLDGENSRFY